MDIDSRIKATLFFMVVCAVSGGVMLHRCHWILAGVSLAMSVTPVVFLAFILYDFSLSPYERMWQKRFEQSIFKKTLW
jgi:uncharacterized membrane protein YGL010W